VLLLDQAAAAPPVPEGQVTDDVWAVEYADQAEDAAAFAALGGKLNGEEILGRVLTWLHGYVAWPSKHAAIAVTLWAAHTHLVEHFDSTPRLALLSPEKRCGKSRVLELLALICAGAETLSDASPPTSTAVSGPGRSPS
jgi:hypothetical protein